MPRNARWRPSDVGIYHSLRIGWRGHGPFATDDLKYCVEVSDAP